MARVDLRSDTVTRPTPAMRQAIANAEVGDDVFGDDPTILRLQDMAAERTGKEAALFTPSGTMANQIAIRIQTQPGDEMLVEGGAHPFNYEAGGPAMISGVTTRTLPGQQGILDPDAVAACFRPKDPHFAPLKLVSAEDTANRGGGTPPSLPAIARAPRSERAPRARRVPARWPPRPWRAPAAGTGAATAARRAAADRMQTRSSAERAAARVAASKRSLVRL